MCGILLESETGFLLIMLCNFSYSLCFHLKQIKTHPEKDAVSVDGCSLFQSHDSDFN